MNVIFFVKETDMKKLIACILLGSALLALSACAKVDDGVITDKPDVTHSAAPAVSSTPNTMVSSKPETSMKPSASP